MAIKLTESKLRQVIREEIASLSEAGLPGYDRWKTEPGPYGTGYESDNDDQVLAVAGALAADSEFVDAIVSMGATSMKELVNDAATLIKDEKMDSLIDMGLESGDDIRDVASTVADDVNRKRALGLR